MRVFLMVGMIASASPAVACNSELLTVQDWSIKQIDATTNEVAYTIMSAAPKGIRMIDGQLGFRDALGKAIGPMAIDRDVNIPAGGTFSYKGRWGQFTFERLLKLKKEEVKPYTCVRAVLFEDGTKEEFR